MSTLESFGRAIAEFAVLESRASFGSFCTDTFMNWFGCAIMGSRRRPVDRAVAFHALDGINALQSPIGRSEQLAVSACVSIDCLSSACLAYDDIHFKTTLHPAGPVAAAILGLSRSRPVAGRDALDALRVGMEVECRMALALLGPTTGATRGWYPTGLVGGFGAAVAVGRLLSFDVARMEIALGLAAARASGTRGTHGAMSAYWVPAVAAESGYVAARLADAGFTCGIASLTGPNGFMRQIAPQPDLATALDALGQRYVCEDTACKPYPFGFIAHAVIQCCVDLQAVLPPGLEDIVEVILDVSPTAASLGAKTVPTNLFEAQVSLSYIAARVLSDPALAVEPLADEFVVDEALGILARRIRVRADAVLQDQQCRCVVRLRGGAEHRTWCEIAPGAPGNLPDSAAVRSKFQRLAAGTVGKARTQQFLAILEDLHDAPDLAALLRV